MSAKGLYHENVVRALQKDGWTITHDPFRLNAGGVYTFVDLGAERLMGAERGNEKIAVEIKSFLSRSKVADLQNAIGQFVFYKPFLADFEPDRVLYLAVTDEIDEVFKNPIGRRFLDDKVVKLIVFDLIQEVVVRRKT